jgi:hypothetical protein
MKEAIGYVVYAVASGITVGMKELTGSLYVAVDNIGNSIQRKTRNHMDNDLRIISYS